MKHLNTSSAFSGEIVDTHTCIVNNHL